MIAISSHRPFSDAHEIAQNQLRAHDSWRQVFDEIIYFGPSESLLTCPKTTFIESEDFPTIESLCIAASLCADYTCLINADIVVGKHLGAVMEEVWRRGGVAATSRRYEFNGEGVHNASIVDWGIDFFWSTPDMWRRVANSVPKHYRIGHSAWDTWVMSFFNTTVGRYFYDITKRQAIFHPKHENRKRVHHIKAVDDKFTMNCGFPYLKL